MHLILDTSIIIELERKNQQIINKIEELKKLYAAQPKISFITYFEILEGIEGKSEKNKEKARAFIELFETIQTTKAAAKNLVLLRKKYELPIPDLLIAAQTIESDGILITKDKDFRSIEELDKIIIE